MRYKKKFLPGETIMDVKDKFNFRWKILENDSKYYYSVQAVGHHGRNNTYSWDADYIDKHFVNADIFDAL